MEQFGMFEKVSPEMRSRRHYISTASNPEDYPSQPKTRIFEQRASSAASHRREIRRRVASIGRSTTRPDIIGLVSIKPTADQRPAMSYNPYGGAYLFAGQRPPHTDLAAAPGYGPPPSFGSFPGAGGPPGMAPPPGLGTSPTCPV